MAKYKIIADNSPYYELEVSFADQKFKQNVVFQEKGEWLGTAMQAYADNYELNWVADKAAQEELAQTETSLEEP